MMINSAQIQQKLDELQIAPPSEPSPHERVVIPGGFRECILLRSHGVGAKYTQAGLLTIPARELPKAQRIITQAGTGSWLEDGRRLMGRGASGL